MKHMWLMKIACISLAIASLTFFRAMAQTPNWIRSVTWNADGSQIAIATEDGMIQILDATGQSLRTIQANSPDAVLTLEWSPDGSKLASGGMDRLVKIWSATTGQPLFSLSGHLQEVRHVAWSPDSSRLVSTNLEALTEANVRIWDATTGQLLHALKLGNAVAVDWSSDGKRLAIGRAHEVDILDADSGQMVDTLKMDNYGTVVKWSPDSSLLAVAYPNGVIQIWNVAASRIVQNFQAHTDVPLSIAWSPDGTKFVSTGLDHTVQIWGTATGQNLTVIQANDRIFSAAWSPYGGRLAYGDVAPQNTASAANVAATPGTTSNTGLHIIVPPSTLADLQAIAHKCVVHSDILATLTPDLTTNQLGPFVDKVKGLSSQQVGPGCAADLIAVANALQKKP